MTDPAPTVEMTAVAPPPARPLIDYGPTPCATCGKVGTEPCTVGVRQAVRHNPHVARLAAIPSTAPEIPADDYEAVWDDLTPVQADAVRATAALLLREPAELAVELFPHLYFPKDAPA